MEEFMYDPRGFKISLYGEMGTAHFMTNKETERYFEKGKYGWLNHPMCNKIIQENLKNINHYGCKWKKKKV